MAVRNVIRMGHPTLLATAQPVTDFDNDTLKILVDDLFDTMASLDGAGLAAPQIGVSLRVVVFGIEANPRYPDAETVPTTVLINPTIIQLKDTKEDDWEGCLSVPGLRGKVPRYTHIKYTGFNEKGQVIDRTVDGFHARVVQHECDHLDGILYPQRMIDMKSFGYNEEIEDVLKTKENKQ